MPVTEKRPHKKSIVEPYKMNPDTHKKITDQRLRVVALFAGIGGVELGLENTGAFRTILFSENDDAASEVLAQRFPGISNVGDIRDLDALPSKTDLVTAGFPCQDLSQAGGTQGINGDRSGLVRHVFRLLEHTHVPWVVLENVPFMLQLNRGAGIRFLVEKLEDLGYQWAYRIVDSRAFGLPHRRQRVFLVASNVTDPAPFLFIDNIGAVPEERERNGHACGFYWTEGIRGLGWAVNAIPTLKGGSTVGIPSAPAIWLPTGEIVTPTIEAAERLQGFPTAWTEPAELIARPGYRWKLVGNAVTVNTAEWIGRCLIRNLENDAKSRIPYRILTTPWPNAACGSSEGRYAVEISKWPIRLQGRSLLSLLGNDRRLLSERATAGFLKRFLSSSLRKPPGFIDALQNHLDRIRESELA